MNAGLYSTDAGRRYISAGAYSIDAGTHYISELVYSTDAGRRYTNAPVHSIGAGHHRTGACVGPIGMVLHNEPASRRQRKTWNGRQQAPPWSAATCRSFSTLNGSQPKAATSVLFLNFIELQRQRNAQNVNFAIVAAADEQLHCSHRSRRYTLGTQSFAFFRTSSDKSQANDPAG
jgi:hypothetical protein